MEYCIAFDIGGTKIECALFNSQYKKLNEKRFLFTKDSSNPEVDISRKDLFKIINDLIEEMKDSKKLKTIKGIGISLPDVISKDGSIIGTNKIKSLSNFKLGNYMRKKYGFKVEVANDADCFAYGETIYGAGKGKSNVVGIIYGTGIGSGIIINKKIYSGTTGSTGEFGHNIVNPNGPKARNGFYGSVEAYCGGPNLVQNYKNAGGKIKNPDSKQIYNAKDTDPIAKQIFNEHLNMFSIGIAQLMHILSPELFILGGGLSNLPVYKELNKLTKQYTIDGLRKQVKIVKNKLGDSAGIYGVAALVFND